MTRLANELRAKRNRKTRVRFETIWKIWNCRGRLFMKNKINNAPRLYVRVPLYTRYDTVLCSRNEKLYESHRQQPTNKSKPLARKRNSKRKNTFQIPLLQYGYYALRYSQEYYSLGLRLSGIKIKLQVFISLPPLAAMLRILVMILVCLAPVLTFDFGFCIL